MDPSQEINERVEVLALYGHPGGHGCLPARMRYRGRTIKFTELALRHPTMQGKRMIHVFHMSDGANGYRLEFDAEALTWTLAAMIAGDGL